WRMRIFASASGYASTARRRRPHTIWPRPVDCTPNPGASGVRPRISRRSATPPVRRSGRACERWETRPSTHRRIFRAFRPTGANPERAPGARGARGLSAWLPAHDDANTLRAHDLRVLAVAVHCEHLARGERARRAIPGECDLASQDQRSHVVRVRVIRRPIV